MADVQFEEPVYGAATPQQSFGPMGLTGFIVRVGLAEDAGQAQKVLLIILVLAAVAAVGVFIFGGGGGSGRPPTPNIDGTPRTTS